MIKEDIDDINFEISEEELKKIQDDIEQLNDISFERVVLKQPLWAVCEQAKSKEKIFFNIDSTQAQLDKMLEKFEFGKEYKMISVKGGFSSINFILYVNKLEQIEEAYFSTLAVGQKQIMEIDRLGIKKACFIIGDVFENRGLAIKYNYYKVFVDICAKNKWKYKCTHNHLKIFLMKTKNYYFVLETSANLNENPKIEQFSFFEDKNTYMFYKNFFDKL